MEKIMLVIDKIVLFLDSFGIIGGFLLVVLESIIPILPLGVIIGVNVLAYGSLFGFVLSYIATICGCMLSFYLFRKYIKNRFEKLFKNKKKSYVIKLMERVSNIDFNALTIILAMPFTPSFLINIAAGLSSIKVKKYFIALLIGKISIIFFWGYVGTSILESFTDIMVLSKLIIIILIAYIISKIVEVIFKVEE